MNNFYFLVKVLRDENYEVIQFKQSLLDEQNQKFGNLLKGVNSLLNFDTVNCAHDVSKN